MKKHTLQENYERFFGKQSLREESLNEESIKQIFNKLSGNERKVESARQLLKQFYGSLSKNKVVVDTGDKSKEPKGISEYKFTDQFQRKFSKEFKVAGIPGAYNLLHILISDGDVENKNGYWKPTNQFKRTLKY